MLDRHVRAGKNARWAVSCLLETDTVSLIFGLLNTHTGEHCACGNTLSLSGFTDVGYEAAGKRKLTSLTILLIFRAFFKVRLSSDVRLWKCEVPFILFKSFLYFSCKGILVWCLNKCVCCQLTARLWQPRCPPFTPQKSDPSHDYHLKREVRWRDPTVQSILTSLAFSWAFFAR